MAGRHRTARTGTRRRLGYAAATLALAGGAAAGARGVTVLVTHHDTGVSRATVSAPPAGRTAGRTGRGVLRGLPTATPRPTLGVPAPAPQAFAAGGHAGTSGPGGGASGGGTAPAPATSTAGTAPAPATSTAGITGTASPSPTSPTSSPTSGPSSSPTASPSPTGSAVRDCPRVQCR